VVIVQFLPPFTGSFVDPFLIDLLAPEAYPTLDIGVGRVVAGDLRAAF
jgi:hypothetical protein